MAACPTNAAAFLDQVAKGIPKPHDKSQQVADEQGSKHHSGRHSYCPEGRQPSSHELEVRSHRRSASRTRQHCPNRNSANKHRNLHPQRKSTMPTANRRKQQLICKGHIHIYIYVCSTVYLSYIRQNTIYSFLFSLIIFRSSRSTCMCKSYILICLSVVNSSIENCQSYI